MQFEWDEEKDRANHAKHDIGFEESKIIFASPMLTAPDDRQDYSQERFISYGQLNPLKESGCTLLGKRLAGAPEPQVQESEDFLLLGSGPGHEVEGR